MGRARVSQHVVEVALATTTWPSPPVALGTNRIRTPSSGTASYTASSSYDANWVPANAADGVTSGAGHEWAAAGSGAGLWWQVDWTVGQTIGQVWLDPRENFGTGGVLLFSDASTIVYSGLTNNGPLVLAAFFTPKTGITSMRITPTAGTYSGNPGLNEAEAYEPGDTMVGCGVSQHVVEVALLAANRARVSQHVIEVAYLDDDTQSDPPTGGGSGPSVHSWGYPG